MDRRETDASRWLEALVREGATGSLDDGELLRRFLAADGSAREAAFETLVRRHGPSVLARCRSILRDEHDAEDAFQATFLILASRAGALRDRARLGAWLGRTASRMAFRARKVAVRRREREASGIDVEVGSVPSANAIVSNAEIGALVRTEVERLSEADRILMRLVYWEGASYEGAAAIISRPIGTVRSRLARARDRLRGRLSRLAPGADLAPMTFAKPTEALILRTTRSVTHFAGTARAVSVGIVPAGVAALLEGELVMSKVRWSLIAGSLIVAGASTAVGLTLRSGSREETERPATVEAGHVDDRLPIANPGVEDGDGDAPKAWKRGAAIPGVEYVWSRTGHDGKASLGLKKTANRYFPIAEWSQEVPREGEAPRLKVAAWVKADKVAKAILDAQFLDAGGKWSHAWVAYIGSREDEDPPVSHDWKRYEGVVAIPPGTKKILIAPQIYGPGSVWFDDLEARYTEEPAIDPLEVRHQ